MKKKPNELCALIVGAGAVENGWNPVLRALREQFPMDLTADGANTHLARAVYLLRWWSTDQTEHGKKCFAETLNYFNKTKATIVSELQLSQKTGEIRARAALSTILDKFIVPNPGRFILLSTNWDHVVETAVHKHLDPHFRCSINTIHIHGSIDDQSTMYFPTEVTKEPYRSPKEEIAIGTVHGTAWRTLETATKAIIYGLSLSPLDAELCQILACGFASNKLKEILIINPHPTDVAHRVNVLLDRRFKVSVFGTTPDNLDAQINYTIR